jgi:hypothetical protein
VATDVLYNLDSGTALRRKTFGHSIGEDSPHQQGKPRPLAFRINGRLMAHGPCRNCDLPHQDAVRAVPRELEIAQWI